MIKIFLLALRNVFRNKRRTGLTVLVIVAGVVSLIIFGGFVSYSFWGLRESTIRSQLGHMQVYYKGYTEKGASNPADYLIENFKEIENKLDAIPHVEVIVPQLSFSGLLSSGENTLTCMGKGVDPEKERKLTSFESLIEGDDLSGDDEIVVGSELYKALGVKLGDYLTLLTTTVDGTINAVDVKLVGVCKSGAKDYDAVIAKMSLSTVQRLLNTTAVGKAVVLLDETEYTDAVAKKMEEMFVKENLPLELRKWNDLADFYQKVVGLYTGIFNVMKAIIIVLVFFSIANTMTMSIFERTREIGTLRAIGTKKRTVITLFLCEGGLIGCLGGGIGLIAGIVIAGIINLAGGINIASPPGMSQGYTALILTTPQVLTYAFVQAIVISIISSFYPAFHAAKLNVVDALRHV